MREARNPARRRNPRCTTNLARLVMMLLDEAERHGASRQSMVRAAGISESRLRDPDARIPVGWAIAVWKDLVARFPDPALGVRFGSSRKTRELGLVGYTMLHSKTLLQALERLARYGRILVDHAEVPLTRSPDGGVRMGLGVDPILDVLRQPVDYRLAWLVVSARELTRTPVVPAEVQLPYRRVPLTPEHTGIFGTNVVFGARKASISFSAQDQARPIASAEHELGGYLEKLAEQTLASLQTDTDALSDRVRRAIWSETRGVKATLDSVARALGIGVRSLQRRLGDENTSFAALLDEVRHAMAVGLLVDQEHSLQEIAFLLGYSDASAFHRAFRRWERIAPRRFRQSRGRSRTS